MVKKIQPQQKNRKLCLDLKPNVTIFNLLSIGLTCTGAIIGLGYVNADLIFLLRDSDYFGISSGKKVGIIQSQIALASLIITAILSLCMGQAYDILGRKLIIIGNYAVIAVLITTIPYTSPSLYFLGCNRVLSHICSHFLTTNPLILDYVEE